MRIQCTRLCYSCRCDIQARCVQPKLHRERDLMSVSTARYQRASACRMTLQILSHGWRRRSPIPEHLALAVLLVPVRQVHLVHSKCDWEKRRGASGMFLRVAADVPAAGIGGAIAGGRTLPNPAGLDA